MTTKQPSHDLAGRYLEAKRHAVSLIISRHRSSTPLPGGAMEPEDLRALSLRADASMVRLARATGQASGRP